ncbi:hypothetical protein NDI45_29585 [Leptolyngbya sp. GB1-A1]|uniref:hypothetical protein n=1 Tax=Leptolyngbya sp. GB1-A1 TaxID=2933908 RepID=UPI003296A2AA
MDAEEAINATLCGSCFNPLIDRRSMRLPDNLYNAVKPPFKHHSPWHLSRLTREDILARNPALIPRWEEAREEFKTKFLNEVGSGEEFLRFHREMI